MALFNFVYQDEYVINSLYAQIFSGFLHSIENSESAKDRESGTAEGGIPSFVKGTALKESSNEVVRTETIFPHDARLLDIFNILKPCMKAEFSNACFGDILHLTGDLLIIHSEIEKNGVDVLFEMFVKNMSIPDVPKNAQGGMKNFIKKMLIPTDEGIRFFFKEKSGNIVRGVLRPENLHEKQKSLLFKFGVYPIPLQMIALCEHVENTQNFLPKESITGGLHMLSNKVSDFYLEGLPPTKAVSPIALFYQINDTDNIEKKL